MRRYDEFILRFKEECIATMEHAQRLRALVREHADRGLGTLLTDDQFAGVTGNITAVQFADAIGSVIAVSDHLINEGHGVNLWRMREMGTDPDPAPAAPTNQPAAPTEPAPSEPAPTEPAPQPTP